MISDPSGASQQFADQDIQDTLDEFRDDVRYEGLTIAPSIVNLNSTSQSASTIFADYYSKYQWWESDVVLQGQDSNGLPWQVLTPLASDYIVGHWQFELTPFINGTAPGQLPPVFATGKVYDLNWAAAELLEVWGAYLSSAYNISVDGQSLQRSQLMTAKLTLADLFRKKAKPRIGKIDRHDVMAPLSTRRMRLLDQDDVVKGA